MDQITLRIIDGPDVGSVFGDVSLPITIGRERGNTIELHDERISRYHLKIVKDNASVLLVDLGSTNGTWVNGNVVQFWSLRPGDLISIGCSRMLFGSRIDIASRLHAIRTHLPKDEGFYPEPSYMMKNSEIMNSKCRGPAWERTLFSVLNAELFTQEEIDLLKGSFPPSIPKGLSPSQIASMTRFFTYYVARFRGFLNDIKVTEADRSNLDDLKERNEPVVRRSFFSRKKKSQEEKDQTEGSVLLSFRQYQNLLDITSLFGDYLGELAKDPNWAPHLGSGDRDPTEGSDQIEVNEDVKV